MQICLLRKKYYITIFKKSFAKILFGWGVWGTGGGLVCLFVFVKTVYLNALTIIMTGKRVKMKCRKYVLFF